MKKSEIMKIFTAKVAELMAHGMWIHGNTMGGSQGEVCKVDLTDGQRMVRVLLDDKSTFGRFDGRHGDDALVLIVGEAKGDRWLRDNRPTVWNNDLDVKEQREFFKMGRDWYVEDPAEIIAANDKYEARYKGRRLENQNWNGEIKVELPGAADKVLSFVRRQPRCKSVRLSQITSVYKTIRKFRGTVEVRYIVETTNKQFRLNAKEA